MRRSLIANGCDPAWLPAWLLPDFCWREACDEHDAAYTRGGTESDRLAADHRLRAAMLDGCSHWHRPLAHVYYAAVRLLGWASFRYRRPRNAVA